MTAEGERQLDILLTFLREREGELVDAEYFRRVMRVGFITEALAAGKSYRWMAQKLNIDQGAVHRFIERYGREIGPKDYARARERFDIQFYTPGGGMT